MTIEIRPVDASEIDALLLNDQRTFGLPPHPAHQSRSWAEGELDRTRIAFENGSIVGASRNYTFELTMPGGRLLPAAAVSWVGVLPTHRRQGVLTRMMAALHNDARDHGEPVAMLTASESVIYGRFGYGVATWRVALSAERTRLRFTGDDDSGAIRLVTRAEGEAALPPIYEQSRRARAGMVSRPDFWWPGVFWDHIGGGPDKAFFVAAHSDASGADDGFVAYQLEGGWNGGLPDRELLVWDMQACSPAAHAALWRYVFGVDLVSKVTITNAPVDDPLRHLVTDSRRVRVDFVNDGLWIAPLDVATMLAARTYAIEGVLVIEVHDGDRPCRYALEGGPDGATCRASTARADLACSAQTLGATILGGTRFSELAYAGLVDEAASGALTRADAMFATAPAPALLSYF
ncbi:MAG TPA: GNAT family N-acetyltransferase [Acidimicrobiia bacterium]|nr:GNAT family N-acetyltransferase [Acidimicrobiia bacterium]